MGTENIGNQIITFRYYQPATSESFNKLNYIISESGIYRGGNLTKKDPTTVTVSALTCLITDSVDDVAIRVETTADADITVTESTPYVVLRMDWQNASLNYMDILSVSYGNIQFSDLIIGRAIYEGGLLQTFFDYSRRDNSILYTDEQKKDNLLVLPTEPYSNQVSVEGGTVIVNNKILNFSGGTSPAFSSVTDGRVDLLAINDSGNLTVTEGTDAVSPVDPSFPDNSLVIARITRGSGYSIINGSHIELLRDINISGGGGGTSTAKNEWVSTIEYDINDIVAYEGTLYRSLQNLNLNFNPLSASDYWEELPLDSPTSLKNEWVSTVTYDNNDIVAHNGVLYISLQGSNLNFNPVSSSDYWTELTLDSTDALKNEWVSTVSYSLNDIVAYGGEFYRSKQNSNQGNTPSTGGDAYWEEWQFGSSGTGGGASTVDYVAEEEITKPDVVCVNSNGNIVLASKDDADLVEVVGFATEYGYNGDTVTVQKIGLLDGFESLDVGQPVFLGNNGFITQDPDNDIKIGEYRVFLGIAKSETEVDIWISEAMLYETDVQYLEAMPVGSVCYWPTSNIPTSYLPCDGRELSRTDYAELFATIGTAYGSGDGSTTFNIPDFRGYFFRAFDDRTSGNVDPFYDEMGRLRAIGEEQLDAMQIHAHNLTAESTTNANGTESIRAGAGAPDGDVSNQSILEPETLSGYDSVKTSDTETRAINIGLYAIIKVRRIDPNVPYDLDTIDDRLTNLENNLLITNKFDTGWIANSDWTNTEFTINHGLNANISELVIKMFISTDGTDDNSFEINNVEYDSSSASGYQTGTSYFAIDKNSFKVQTGADGLTMIVDSGGTLTTIDTESYYYRCVVYKPTSISYLRASLESVGSYKYSTGWVNLTDWTNANETISHNFNTGISDLIIKMFISSDGTDGNAFELNNMMVIYDSTSASNLDATYGVNFYQTDSNNILMATGANGLQYIRDTDGARVNLSTGYYKVVVYKPDVIQKYEDTNKLDLANADTDWHEIGGTGEPAFENGWVNYGGGYDTLAYRKDAMGFVHLKGAIKSGTGINVFTLPTGYRPAGNQQFAGVMVFEGSTYYDTGGQIRSDGTVRTNSSSYNDYIDFSGITFYAEG